jgi:competence protein ComEC
VSLLAGIFFSSLVHWSLPVWWMLIILGLLAGFLLQCRFHRILPVLAFLVFILAGLRNQAAQPVLSPNFIAWYNDRLYPVTLSGWLVSPPDQRDSYANVRLRLESIDTGDRSLPVQGLILARLPAGTDYRVGTLLKLTGYLKTPPANPDFSYRDYLIRQGIHSIFQPLQVTSLGIQRGNFFSSILFSFKDSLLVFTRQLFPQPEAALLSGILLGVDTTISPALQQAFKDTGTSHIIAISGFNIAILAGLFSLIFSRLFGSRRGAVVAVLAIAFYTLLVGAEASVVRAAIMGGSTLLGRQLNRRQDGLNTLGFVAGLMCLFNPFLPWDVGFQLTFAATLGLVLYAQPMQNTVEAWLAHRLPPSTTRKVAVPLTEYFLFTLAAQLTTLPIMAYHFGRISLVAVLANPFILPAQPALMVLSGLALLLGFIYFPLGQLIAWLALPFSTYTIRMVEFFDRFPHAVLLLADFSLLFVLLYYFVLFFFTFARDRQRRLMRRLLNPAILLAVLFIISMLTWRVALALPDGRLHLTFLDVGSAEAILIQTPSGRTLLINGGPSRSVLADALGRRLSPFSRREDVLLVASSQETQLAALAGVLDMYPPEMVLWSGLANASSSSLRLQSGLAAAAIPIIPAQPGQRFDLGGGARLEVLQVTGRGSVLLLEWGGFRALLPSGQDLVSLESAATVPSLAPLSVLMLADSGLAAFNPPGWIASLHPLLTVLSVSPADPDGLPDAQTLAALQGTTLLRTDRSGWIHISTDGTRMWVETER